MIIIFDVDGTLMNIDHRRHFVEGDKKDWKSFNESMVGDIHNGKIFMLYQILTQEQKIIECNPKPIYESVNTVIIVSGRSENFKVITEDQLNPSIYNKLYMREKGDYRKDVEVKRDMLEQIRKDYGEPGLVFDDRKCCVDFWRSEGITCCQVAEGDF